MGSKNVTIHLNRAKQFTAHILLFVVSAELLKGTNILQGSEPTLDVSMQRHGATRKHYHTDPGVAQNANV